MKIRGNTVGTTMPRANWDQEDPKKADYIKGRDKVNKAIEDAQTAADDAQTAADDAQTAADNAKTAADNAQTAADNAQTAADNAKTATDNHAADLENPHGVTPAQIGAQAQHRRALVTLAAADWANNKQTVAVDFATTGNTIFASPDPDSYDAYAESGIQVTEQADGSVTFECENVPAADIDVNLAIFTDGIGGAAGGNDYAVTAISVTESADGTVTIANTLDNGEPETLVISPDANGNPSKLTYNGTEIPITWNEVT